MPLFVVNGAVKAPANRKCLAVHTDAPCLCDEGADVDGPWLNAEQSAADIAGKGGNGAGAQPLRAARRRVGVSNREDHGLLRVNQIVNSRSSYVLRGTLSRGVSRDSPLSVWKTLETVAVPRAADARGGAGEAR